MMCIHSHHNDDGNNNAYICIIIYTQQRKDENDNRNNDMYIYIYTWIIAYGMLQGTFQQQRPNGILLLSMDIAWANTFEYVFC